MNIEKTYEYINDFLYFVIRKDKSGGEGSINYCSGVNLIRFSPITKGRHGLFSNPTFRMLQLVKHGVSSLALSKGATPKKIKGDVCIGIPPTKDTWYIESLLIECAPESLPVEIINYCAINYMRKLIKACHLPVEPPDKLPAPQELQSFLEDLCIKYGT